MALGVSAGAEDVLEGGDEKADGAAGGVEDGLPLLRIDDADDEINDVARGAELAGIALGAEDEEQILEGIAEALAVVVAELVDDLEEGLEGLGVAVREVGVFEDGAEERWDAGVLGHLGNAFAIKAKHLVTAEGGSHQLRPTIA